MPIQTFIFSKRQWTVERARAWLRRHNRRSSNVEATTNTFRFRQFAPSRCRAGSFQALTQNFPAGLSAVNCGTGARESDPLVLASLAASGPAPRSVAAPLVLREVIRRTGTS